MSRTASRWLRVRVAVCATVLTLIPALMAPGPLRAAHSHAQGVAPCAGLQLAGTEAAPTEVWRSEEGLLPSRAGPYTRPVLTPKAVISTTVDNGSSFSAIVATDRGTGKTTWTYPFEAQYFGVGGDRLVGFWQHDSSLDYVALDAGTGHELWTKSYVLFAEPVLFDDATAYLRVGSQFNPQRVRAIDLSTGEMAWETPFDLSGDLVKLVKLGDGTLVAAAMNSGFAITLHGIDASSGQEVWRSRAEYLAEGGGPDITATGDHGFALSTGDAGHLLGYDGISGEMTWDLSLWSDDLKVNARERVAIGSLLDIKVTNQSSGPQMMEIDTDEGEVQWMAPIPSASYITGTADDVLVLWGGNTIFGFDRETQAVRWRINTSEQMNWVRADSDGVFVMFDPLGFGYNKCLVALTFNT